MNDNIKDAILKLQQGESEAFLDAVNHELMGKARDAIELERVSAGQKFFSPEAEVEVEDDEAEETEQE